MAAPQLHYPDLVPPPNWTYFRLGTQVRLIPPGTGPDSAPVTIIISPLVGRTPQMPGLADLVAQAIDAEAKMSLEITSKTGPTPVQTPTGLEGVCFDVQGYARPHNPVEHRIYVMLGDDRCLYGVSYLSSPAAFDAHVDTFWSVVRSVRPFEGRQGAASKAEPYPFPIE